MHVASQDALLCQPHMHALGTQPVVRVQGIVKHLCATLCAAAVDINAAAAQSSVALDMQRVAISALCECVKSASTTTCTELASSLPWAQLSVWLSERGTRMGANVWRLLQNVSHSTRQDQNHQHVLAWAGLGILQQAEQVAAGASAGLTHFWRTAGTCACLLHACLRL